MVQLPQIISVNAAAFALLMIVKLHMRLQAGGKHLLDARLLTVMMNLTMFQCVFDTLVFWVDGQTFPGARVLNIVGNVIYYILNVTVAYFWPLFTEYKINSSVERLKKTAFILGIPLALTALLIISTPFNGIVFTVSEDNIYARSSFFYALPTVLIFVYVVCGTLNVYLHRDKGGKYMIFPALYFVIPLTLAMVMQMLFYGVSLIFIGIAIAITGVYMSTQNESAYLDSLCGVYNRRYYNDYVRSFCNSGKMSALLTGVLIDMDDFKPINDKFGHQTGDMALVKFSEVLRRNMGDIGFAVRYGGDEFILVTGLPPQETREVVQRIAQEIEQINASGANEYKLGFSYGMATINTGGDPDDLLSMMDSRMYEMKQERKKQISKAAE